MSVSLTVIWDFDYTLFDAAAFRAALRKAAEVQGVSAERFEETYRRTVSQGGAGYDYDPERHLRMMADDLGSAEAVESLRASFQAILADTSPYLYSAARPVLERLRTAGFRQVLLTLGNAAWQERKVVASGLAGLFDRVIPCDDKVAALERLVSELAGPAVVVNDNGREVAALRRRCPDCRFLLVAGPKPIPDDLGLEPLAGLPEAERAIIEQRL